MDIRIRIDDNCAIAGFNYFVYMNNTDHTDSSSSTICVTKEECVEAIKAYFAKEVKY